MSESSPAAARPVRADARRNVRQLLRAALEVFEQAGVDAPVRQIAERAGVGIGTIYRHFPTRADLVAAVFRHEVEACVAAAAAMAAVHAPEAALRAWVGRYVELIAAKRGLAAALESDHPAYAGLPAYFEERLVPALDGLLAACGTLRTDITAWDLLWAVARLSTPTRTGSLALALRMVDVLLDGLRRPELAAHSGRA